MLIFTRIIALLVSFLIVCAIFYNVISNYILTNSSNSPSRYDPFNFENRIEYLNSAVLKSEISPDEIATFQELADAGIIYEPLNARILALKGVLKQRSDKEAAQPYYVKALDLKPTDRIALTQRYLYLVEKKKFKEAIPLFVLISARYPSNFSKLLPSTPLLLQSQDNRDEVLSNFKSRKDKLQLIVESLVKDSQYINLAYNLVLNAHEKYKLEVHEMSRPVIRELMKQDRVSDAYLLFYKTLSEEEKKNLGYVYNANFSNEPIASFFDWSISPQAGVIMKRIQTRVLSLDSGEKTKQGGLEIRFLNAPVAFSNVSQLLYLPKKAYELSINYTIDDIRGPSPISVKLFCESTNTKLAEIELSRAKTVEEVKTTTFVVPSNGCELQKILISNNNIVKSWKNRFSGKVILHEISIKSPSS